MSTVKEIKLVKTRKVYCDGGSISGHPRVFLEIKHNEEEISCPYCGQKFLYVNNDSDVQAVSGKK
jgi:uncharacterized Zn-finger protein